MQRHGEPPAEPIGGGGSDDSRDPVEVVPLGRLKRTITGTTVGNLIEWYDFGVFAFLVPTISQVFFAGGSSSLVATFTIFAASFVVRPLGGLLFGPLGDRIGRQRVLAITIISMAVGTFAIGLIPDQATIGVWSAVLLLAARLVQGFSTGGEYAGAMTYLGEHAPDTRRGFLASWLEFGTLAGYILGAAVATVITAVVPPEVLLSWGWRVPFLIAGPLGLIGLYIRTQLHESPAYEQQAREGEDVNERSVGEQIQDTVVRPWRPLLLCMGLVAAHNVTNYTLTQYLPTYLSEEVRLPYTPALLVVLAAMAVVAGLVTLSGRLSDRVGRNPILYLGCGLQLLLGIPAFLLLSTGGYVTAFLGALLVGLMLLCFNSTLPATLPALFPVGTRYGSLAIAYNLAVSLFGGVTPLVATLLVTGTGSLVMPGVVLVAAGVIGAVSVYRLRETAGRPMPGSDPTAASEEEARRMERGEN